MRKILFKMILKEIKKDDQITEGYLAKKFQVSERTIRRYMCILKDEGKIELTGRGIKRKWKLL